MKRALWLVWLLSSAALAGFLAVNLNSENSQEEFLPGPLTHGHHQIEMECGACHTSPFGGEDVLQDACMTCHGSELKASLDSHPKTKFTNPRNVDLVKELDARYCMTCHVEHNPDITHPMGVTFPEDYCVQCHEDIGEERDTHKGLGFDTCASAGCHNFHDNRALYEDFLLKHKGLENPESRQQLSSGLTDYFNAIGSSWPRVEEPEASALAHSDATITQEWHDSAHGEAGVGCLSCHGGSAENWIEKPKHEQCIDCHKSETEGFLAGKHGMRLAHGLSPMTPAMARQPMHEDVGHLELGCNSCHSAHSYNRIEASVSACVGCHADEHTQNFIASPHGALWSEVEAGTRAPEDAVSCATCHMPREENTVFGERIVQVQHNQNATLRPNEKMIRPACLNCHSLSFSIDALADPALIQSNFNGQPSAHIRSIDMAIEREESYRAKRK